MSKPLRITLIIMGAILSLLMFVYILMTNLYRGRFGVGVWINGIYATGMTANEVSHILDEKDFSADLPETVLFTARGGEVISIPTAALDINRSYRASVKKAMESQNPLTWFKGVMGGEYILAEPETTFNYKTLEAAFDKWDIFEEQTEEVTRIENTPAGYQLVMETGGMPVKSAMLSLASEKIESGETIISLDKEECYASAGDVEQTASVLKTWGAIERLRNIGIVYVMGEDRIPINASVTDSWILTGDELERLKNGTAKDGVGRAARAEDTEDEEEGEPEEEHYLVGGEETTLPQDAHEVNGIAVSGDGDLLIKISELDAFVDDFCERYSTLDGERSFTTVDGRTVKVPSGTYGNVIDAEAEREWLINAVMKNEPEEHVPVLLHEARQLGDDDIGDTYIEVDVARQKLFFVKDGQIDTELPVVTGNKAAHCDTPPGVYDIYFMQRNRTLRGPGYASFVNCWIAFYGHYGIHDASWRSEFGGEIYKTNGSHGCVNIPKSEAGALYDKLEVGVPVIVHE